MEEKFWDEFLNFVRPNMNEHVFALWVEPMKFIRWDQAEKTLEVSVPNPMKLKYAIANYKKVIESLADDFFGVQGTDVRFVLDTNKDVLANKISISNISISKNVSENTAHSASMMPKSAPLSLDEKLKSFGINPQQSFENFVEGQENKMAVASALQVVNCPGEMGNNPLFIYGNTGLGKTHMMQAIGIELIKQDKVKKAQFISAQTFLNNYVKAARTKDYDSFRQDYESLDLLLIDDIQILVGKEVTINEFFNLYEILLNNQCQVVITSDVPVNQLKGFHQRLISRFSSGLTVGMRAPGLEMRQAIVERKAQQQGLELGEGVSFYIARNIERNVRELEGAINRLKTYAMSFGQRVIDIDCCRSVISGYITTTLSHVGIEEVKKTVADYYNVRIQDINSKNRRKKIALARHVAMYLCRELVKKSQTEIGEAFGKDHTTVMHACNKIASNRETDSELNHQLNILEQSIKG
ncbi:hypothetical protein IX83_00135 [Basilea psittacipulmonis DSM 24701]|uniref:Chromosomal replication initiator protein DnaA n=2 Tax=Basilea TaxID=1472344 RepID=A0A077DBA2_9BURK|nr:hypothetical protein IX83_00135 [Basilea psittacipulmonis DSM 24701]